MAAIPVFMPLLFHWRPAGEPKARVLENAYLFIEVSEREFAEQLRRQVGEGSVVAGSSEPSSPLRFIARTDPRGVLMTLSARSPLAADPLSLSALSPLLCPLGTTMRLWWTTSPQAFDDVQRDARERRTGPTVPMGQCRLVFDEHTELPRAVEEVLLDRADGGELRPALSALRAESFPEELLRLGEDGRSWHIELRDHVLEQAIECALTVRELSELGLQHHVPAHQLLIDQVLGILERRGKHSNPLQSVVGAHARLGALEYRALHDDLDAVVRRCSQGVKASAPSLQALSDAALYELSLHPYPDGKFERESGAVPRTWAAKLLMDAAALTLFDELAQALYDPSQKGLESRLLSIASGDGDPAEADAAEQFVARTRAVVGWLSKTSSHVRRGVSFAGAVVDPKTVEAVTSWLEPIVLAAIQQKQATTKATVAAVTRAMRMVQAWTGHTADFEFELLRKQVPLQGAPEAEMHRFTYLANADRWAARFERASRLLKLLNVFSLWDAMIKPQDQAPPVLKQMTDLHGLVEGLEGTYRILSDTAKTELGVTLKALSKPMATVSIYLGLERTWVKLQVGDALGARLVASGVLIAVLTLAMELSATAPHPAAKAALLLAGLIFGVAAEYTMDEEEKFLESYRPKCERTGAYQKAREGVQAIERALQDLEWEVEKGSERTRRLLR